MTKKKRIPLLKERTLLSDVLPNEVPIIFSNRFFYDFLVNKRKNKTEKKIYDELLNPESGKRKVPFGYRISHKKDSFRNLSIMHPEKQIATMNFYEKYKDLILYYCSISPFSIRKPSRVAKILFYKDNLHFSKNVSSIDISLIEESNREYEHLKTYFAYEKYSNIYKFYESHEFHRAEKRYDKMIKFDVSKCFDSIYTHTIAWAIFGKEFAKDNICKTKGVFADDFDALMQGINWGETNGIIIGPEVSRIFSEIIMQRIDKNVFVELEKGKVGGGIRHKRDYEIFRYVDDFFVFYNDDLVKDRIFNEYKLRMEEYKLYVNDSKTQIYEKPIITDISIAKQKISKLLEDKFEINYKDASDGTDIKEQLVYSFGDRSLITDYKSIIRQSGICYGNVLNYSLSILGRKLKDLIKDKKDHIYAEDILVKNIKKIISFSFFLYSVDPKVNHCVNFSIILGRCLKFIQVGIIKSSNNKDAIRSIIFHEICFILDKNKNSKYTQMENLYLIILLREVGRHHILSLKKVCNYFSIIEDKNDKSLKFQHEPNYFEIIVLIYYIKDKQRFKKLLDFVEDHIYEKFEMSKNNKTAEMTMLFLDILSCPYVSPGLKDRLLPYYDFDKYDLDVISSKNWFIKWKNINLEKELHSKKSQHVY